IAGSRRPRNVKFAPCTSWIFMVLLPMANETTWKFIVRHGWTCSGHPRLCFGAARKPWMPATSAGMTGQWNLMARESGGKLENFAHLRGLVDASGIARHPGRVHRLRGDDVKTLPPDAGGAEAAGHAQAPDEAIENVASVLARVVHRCRYQVLPR